MYVDVLPRLLNAETQHFKQGLVADKVNFCPCRCDNPKGWGADLSARSSVYAAKGTGRFARVKKEPRRRTRQRAGRRRRRKADAKDVLTMKPPIPAPNKDVKAICRRFDISRASLYRPVGSASKWGRPFQKFQLTRIPGNCDAESGGLWHATSDLRAKNAGQSCCRVSENAGFRVYNKQ